MKVSDLAQELPPHSIAGNARQGVSNAAAESVPGFQPGDFILSEAHGFRHRIIRFGQRLRLPGKYKSHASYTHAALIVSSHGDLLEAVGEQVRPSSLRQYVQAKEVYQVIRIELSPEERRHVVDFASSVLDRPVPATGLLRILVTTLWAFTGLRLMFFMDGSFTPSGLVAEALVRIGARFGVSAARIMPAQLAVLFGAPPPPDTGSGHREPPKTEQAAPSRVQVAAPTLDEEFRSTVREIQNEHSLQAEAFNRAEATLDAVYNRVGPPPGWRPSDTISPNGGAA